MSIGVASSAKSIYNWIWPTTLLLMGSVHLFDLAAIPNVMHIPPRKNTLPTVPFLIEQLCHEDFHSRRNLLFPT
jgi:hypothetical protein